MKIIIAGAGAVGTHLAQLLSRERHDITVMDENREHMGDLSSNFDLLTICDSPMSIQALKEAEVDKADLFIGVTPDEAHNMTCCMLASKLGARKTVARVDNYEYTLEENKSFFRSVGIDSIIYPEMLAGREIISNIKRSWVRQWIDIRDGELIMVGVKLRETAQILNKPLRDLFDPATPCHVVAVKRAEDTIIPHGNDSLQLGDIAFFMTTPEYVNYIREITGKDKYPDVKTIFFMGGSSTAVHALWNMPDYMHAKVFEPNPKRCERLNELLAGQSNVLVINGDGTDPNLLMDEGIHKAEAFAALTGSSEQNILACLSARRLGIKKTVAMVENSDYIKVAENLDIGFIINKKTYAASHIYQMMLKADITTMKNLLVANADVAEFQVNPGARIASKPVMELHLPSTVNLGGLVRDGKGLLINGRTQIQPGDTVVAFCLENEVKRLEKFFH